jgi:pullulanase/glycogen debranching enzyme
MFFCVSVCVCVCVYVCAGDVWHIALPGCDSSLLYGYRVSGANQSKNNAPSAAGHKFDDVSPSQLCIDRTLFQTLLAVHITNLEVQRLPSV